MNTSAELNFRQQLDAIFTQLTPQAVEEFYAAYRQWTLQQLVAELQQRIVQVRQQQADNEQRKQQAQPSPIALAALARLQSNGVSDIDLLDIMLERGEAWLDQTMQRLDYCESFSDFISDDYTQWCQRALEGAFDWIDSLRDATTHEETPTTLEAPSEAVTPGSEESGAMEALLLQKLATEEEEAPAEIALPEDIPPPDAAVQRELNEPAAVGKSASDEPVLHEDQALATSESRAPVRRTPQKRGWLWRLLWVLLGK
ncbi:MAG: hypothetical protein NVS3B14_16440 [Ktedonobacteraceae bacterium]